MRTTKITKSIEKKSKKVIEMKLELMQLGDKLKEGCPPNSLA